MPTAAPTRVPLTRNTAELLAALAVASIRPHRLMSHADQHVAAAAMLAATRATVAGYDVGDCTAEDVSAAALDAVTDVYAATGTTALDLIGDAVLAQLRPATVTA